MLSTLFPYRSWALFRSSLISATGRILNFHIFPRFPPMMLEIIQKKKKPGALSHQVSSFCQRYFFNTHTTLYVPAPGYVTSGMCNFCTNHFFIGPSGEDGDCKVWVRGKWEKRILIPDKMRRVHKKASAKSNSLRCKKQ